MSSQPFHFFAELQVGLRFEILYEVVILFLQILTKFCIVKSKSQLTRCSRPRLPCRHRWTSWTARSPRSSRPSCRRCSFASCCFSRCTCCSWWQSRCCSAYYICHWKKL